MDLAVLTQRRHDAPDKIQSLLPFLDETVQEGMITIESVRILKYCHRESNLEAE